MTAKEYLSQIRKCDNQINNKLAEIKRLREFATSITSTLKEDVVQSGSGGKSRVAEAVDKIVDLEREINADIDKLVDLKREIMAVIDQIDSPYRDILYKRYYQYATWEQISVEMNYSYRHTTRMHGRALLKLKDVLECPIDADV